ncbi:MAG: energy-coupling factor transporter transmembrane component T [Chloroflexota bacterium]
MLDPRLWLLWALTVLVAASSARNPLYAAVLLLIAMVVGATCAESERQRAPLSPLHFGMIAIPLSALFNAVTVSFGDTVLFALPRWLPLLGGAVTLEAVVFGSVNGLVLTVIFSSFAIFNAVTPVRDLIKMTPRAFHEAGVVLSIALTFVPQTARSLQRIREAQAVRGHHVRGVRDWLPIVVPLLTSGLERSMGLAEAMVARGYGAVSDQAQPLRSQALLALGLLVLLVGWLAYLFRPAWQLIAVGAMLLGALLIGAVVWLAGRSVSHTVYRSRHWTYSDTAALLGCLLTLAVAVTQREALYYSPYPRLTAPPFNPLIGLSLLGLILPALIGLRSEEEARP